MTLLIILAVVQSYIAIPWWAWSVAIFHATYTAFSFYVVVRQEWARRALAKQGEAFLENMLETLSRHGPPNTPPPPLYGMGPKNTVN